MIEKRFFYIETFGCQMNVHDSEKIHATLVEHGWIPAESPREADVVILNTCAVREKAEQKVFSRIGRIAIMQEKNPKIHIVIAGCMAQAWGKRLFKRAPKIDVVTGPGAIERLPGILESLMTQPQKYLDIKQQPGIFTVHPELIPLEKPHSAWLTVMEGCNNFCAYCIVPYVRGREQSREAGSIIEEVKRYVERGVKEITLLGQNVNSYKGGSGGFPELLFLVNQIDGLHRIRFTTSHPKDMSDELIHAVAELEKVCEFIHFPAQSGSNRILEKMERGYSREHYLQRIQKIRENINTVSLSSDFIIGYPGESEEDYQETINLVKTIKFDNVFAFNYSIRSGTKAADLPDDVPKLVKTRRLKALIDLQQQITLEKNQSWIGQIVEVLVEGQEKRGGGKITGRTRLNRIVNFEGSDSFPGSLVQVFIESASPNCLYGKAVPEGKCDQIRC